MHTQAKVSTVNRAMQRMNTEIRSIISARLKEERERLRLSQTEMAELGGTKMRTYQDWERGLSGVSAEFLASVVEDGLDALYVLTGVRSPLSSETLSADESRLISDYRKIVAEHQRTLLAVGAAMAQLASLQPTPAPAAGGASDLPGELVRSKARKLQREA